MGFTGPENCRSAGTPTMRKPAAATASFTSITFSTAISSAPQPKVRKGA